MFTSMFTARFTTLASILALGVSGAALAQNETPVLAGPSVDAPNVDDDRPRMHRRAGNERPLAKLMKELDVDDAQRTALRDAFREFRQAQHKIVGPRRGGAMGASGDERAGRGRGVGPRRGGDMGASGDDGARRGLGRGEGRGAGKGERQGRRPGMKDLTDAQRAELKALRTKFMSDMRGLLDPDQLVIFDRHAKELLRPGRDGRRGRASRERMLERFDLDGNGVLDESERAAAKAAGAERRGRMLEQFDTNGDGELDQTEREAMREQRHAEMLDAFDMDGDGRLSDEERREARRVRNQSRR